MPGPPSSRAPRAVRKVAIVRLSAIGDVVHGLPLAASIRRLHPDAEVTWIVQPEPAPLLAGHPFVDRTLEFPRRRGLAAVTRFLAGLRREAFDLAIDLQGNSKSALVFSALRAARRVALDRRDCRELPAALVPAVRAGPPAGPHSVDRTLALCRRLGDPAPRPDFGLAPTAAELAGARAALADVPGPAIAVSVGDAADVREWSDARWTEAVRAIRAAGLAVLVLAGPRHAERGHRLAREGGAAPRCGVTDLRGLLADLAVLAERPALLVACDSAPVHLAVAVGLPVLALAGPQDPARTGPWRGEWIAAPERPSCAPCRKRRCLLREEPRACMERIGPADVVARARSLLASVG